jgi:hypothetical protein
VIPTRTIEATGRIALYGIFFDTDKTDLKPESTPTLTEIAQMMKANPKLAILVVGHTDKQGAYEYNIDLSRRRADAVVKALTASHSVDAKRTRGAGVGMLAPAATNDTDEGRANPARRDRQAELACSGRSLVHFCFAMNASILRASTTIGTPPPVTNASSNLRRSNFAPNSFCAFVRKRLISL